jgi:hypothetical protein
MYLQKHQAGLLTLLVNYFTNILGKNAYHLTETSLSVIENK